MLLTSSALETKYHENDFVLARETLAEFVVERTCLCHVHEFDCVLLVGILISGQVDSSEATLSNTLLHAIVVQYRAIIKHFS